MVTVNGALDLEQYPLPNPSELFARLVGGKKFTKLDFSQGYQQLLLDQKSTITVNTLKGLYRYNTLTFGIVSVPAIFKKTIDTILQGISGVICYIDDILVIRDDDEDHFQNLAEVLRHLQLQGIRKKKSKCYFMETSVVYLGH